MMVVVKNGQYCYMKLRLAAVNISNEVARFRNAVTNMPEAKPVPVRGGILADVCIVLAQN